MERDELDRLILDLEPSPAEVLPADLVRLAIERLALDGRAERVAQSYGQRLLEHHFGLRVQRPTNRSASLGEAEARRVEEAVNAVAALWRDVAALKGAEDRSWLPVAREELLALRGRLSSPLETGRLRRSALAG